MRSGSTVDELSWRSGRGGARAVAPVPSDWLLPLASACRLSPFAFRLEQADAPEVVEVEDADDAPVVAGDDDRRDPPGL